ncbi:MAG: adenylate/guanylate cyclase domain-containing protein [Desulfobulbaceae bacterium]|nr:adenylate/guanylate cyclase domain-containing protein [Desulfobulbaceae bacterium]
MVGMLLVQFGGMPLLGDLPTRLELLTFDARLQRSKGLSATNSQTKIVIVDIDERSLREHGRWPWSRAKVAEMVERLADAGASVVAFDVMFSEPEINPAIEVSNILKKQGESSRVLAEQLFQFKDAFDRDQRFADVLAGKEVVLGYAFYPGRSNRAGLLPQPLPLSNPEVVAKSSLVTIAGYNANLPVLTEAALGSGFFNLEPDIDGVVRRTPLVVRHDNQLYCSLALEVLRHYLLVESFTLQTSLLNGVETVEAIDLEGYGSIPLDGQGQMVVPFLGPQGSFPYLSASDVLAGTQKSQVEGAIVLVGTTAPGLFDLRATPVQAVYPGVEIQANLIDAILAKRFFEQPDWTRGADFVISVIVGLLMALVVPVLTPLRQILWSMAVMVGVVVLNLVLWQKGLVLSLAMPLMLTALLATFSLGYGFLGESRSRRQLTEMFGQYVPPQLVHEMSENPKNYGFDGETRELTVLFADIRGFTTLSETMSAGDLKKLLNRYFTPMTRIIFETRGTIDKYVGDQIMAFWGAPVHDEHHAVHAIEASLRMLAETERLKQEFRAEKLPEINIGIGCNSGPMNVGDMGSEYRRAYTVLGDAVNLGARLEGTTKYYGVGLVVGEKTREQAGDAFVFRDLDLVKVKGKTQAILVYEPICRANEAGDELRRELEEYHQALADFRGQRWEIARVGFAKLQQTHQNRHIYPLYLDRIANLLAAGNRRENWDGVYERREK